MVLFTRSYNIPKRRPPKLNGVGLTIKDHTKYLGVILDSKMMRKFNVEERLKMAYVPSMHIRRCLGLALRCFGVVNCCQQNLIHKSLERIKHHAVLSIT